MKHNAIKLWIMVLCEIFDVEVISSSCSLWLVNWFKNYIFMKGNAIKLWIMVLYKTYDVEWFQAIAACDLSIDLKNILSNETQCYKILDNGTLRGPWCRRDFKELKLVIGQLI